MSRRLANRGYDADRRANRKTRRLYSTARWLTLRANHLAEHPLCKMCERDGVVTPATVCDHVEPHRDDVDAFWRGPFQSLCDPCHSSRKQREEHGRESLTWGADGWPI